MKQFFSRNKYFARLLNDRKGQSIVEITLVAPLLLLALYVPADFGISLFTAHLTQNASREGARIGSTWLECGSSPCLAEVSNVNCSSNNDVITEVCARLPARLTSPQITVALIDSGSADCMKSVRVTVSGTYNFFLYQLARLLNITNVPDTLPISRSTQMRYDYQPNSNNTPCTA